MNPALPDAALGYAARGWPVFPCTPGAKTPAGRLAPHGVLDATTDPAVIRSWWQRQPAANIGIATGAPGPDVIDVDVKDGRTGLGWFAGLHRAGLAAGASWHVSTPSGGLHAYYAGSRQRNGTIRGKLIDFRGAGGYVIAPPSIISGKPYTGTPLTGPAELVDWRAIRAFLDPPPEFTQPAATPREPSGSQDRPGDDYAARTSWTDILQPCGWRKVRDLGNGRACWCRPGKQGPFTSATTREDGGLYVFSTSTGFQPEVPYSKFGAYALLDHHGDHQAAARALRQAGYGQSPAMTAAWTQQPAPSAPEAAGDRASELRAALLSSNALDDLPVPRPLIEGVLYWDSLVWLHGKPGSGKSFIALDWACCIAAGLPWQMHETKPGPVLYVIAEGVSGLRQRVRAWEDHAQQRTGVQFLPVAVQFPDPRDLTALITLTAELQPVLVVVDTQARVIVGADENSAKDMGQFVAAADRLRQVCQAAIAIVHHETRGAENMRGSTALEGAATTLIRVTKDGDRLNVECTKQKDAPQFESMDLMMTPRLDSVVITAPTGADYRQQASAIEQSILNTLHDVFGPDGAPGGQLRDMVMKLSGKSHDTHHRALRRLIETGQVLSVGSRHRPHYIIPESGQTHAK